MVGRRDLLSGIAEAMAGNPGERGRLRDPGVVEDIRLLSRGRLRDPGDVFETRNSKFQKWRLRRNFWYRHLTERELNKSHIF